MFKINDYSPYQFGFFRIIFGLYLMTHFLLLMPHAHELLEITGLVPFNTLLPMQIFLSSLILLSLFFTLGIGRKIVALLLFLASCCLIDRNFLGPTLTLPYSEIILLACACAPAGEAFVLLPKNSFDKHWKMPRWLLGGAWLVLALCYFMSGLYRLQNPAWLILAQPSNLLKILSWSFIAFELSFIILCIFEKTRKWAWLIMTLIQVIILVTGIHSELTLSLLLLHLFVFDARWLKARTFKEYPIIFFDGHCGLCDGFVNFVMSEDHEHIMRFSPLQGQSAKSFINTGEIEKLQSIVLFDNNKLYRQSDAVLRTLSYLGGLWKLLAWAAVIPRPIRDGVYKFIAQYRYKWFGHHESCRIPTPEEKRYFLP